MLARVLAPAGIDVTSRIVDVECDISNGLPAFIVVGLADKAVDEAKERVRGALRHANLNLPPRRITLNLAPADLPKDGTSFDLAMAVALLCATGQVRVDTSNKLFAGELSLDGSLRPIRAVLSHAQAAKQNQLAELYVPASNASEAALCDGVRIFPVSDLAELYRHLIGEQPIEPLSKRPTIPKLTAPPIEVDFNLVQGQAHAKRALEIAAAGGHNVLMSGPPGSGKTMLARALAGILPGLSFNELVEINQIHSLAGLTTKGLVLARPFRNPHHTASSVAMIGGGRLPRPGEISLSHHGVLFLDELPEFPRSVLEVLRQPLEDGQVAIARATGSVTYPAKFMLVATQNPCPCGFASDPNKHCTCTPNQINRYSKRVSGPLIDRIDLNIEVAAVTSQELTTKPSGEPSSTIANRVQAARKLQAQRFGSAQMNNAQMSNANLRAWCRLDQPSTILADQAVNNLQLSARGYMRLLRVARTIADLDQNENIAKHHITEALQYRARVTA